MQTISLNGSWEFRAAASGAWMPAEVPGTVYGDLLRTGQMQDPFVGDRELQAMEQMEQDFLYRRDFMVPETFLRAESVLLRCEGLDTVADIRVNGAPVGHADNMHRTWEFDVKAQLHAGQNRIEVHFFSPLQYIRQAYAQQPADGCGECTTGFATLRKAHCQFGWDWGPRLPDAGIWRSICLVGIEQARLRTVQIEQYHKENEVRVCMTPDVQVVESAAELCCRVQVTAPDGSCRQAARQGDGWQITIPQPQLWWPNGLGEHPLYTVEVILEDKTGRELDRWCRRIGLRTMEVRREPDAWGESFAHCVNGVPFFAMGADYIPEDSILGRRSAERTEQLLRDCALAHYNVIRVWGGGCYPDDWFFDLCDELGLVVWQDFMFACAVYNLTPAFEENILAELRDNITRIRHHACIGLFCGNNEMEMFVQKGFWVRQPRQMADYIKMYEYLFPRLVKELAPQIFYWPASPSSGGSFDDPNAADRGDVHYWDVWGGDKPFSDYQNYYFRYLSEFGFESFPCRRTIGAFAAPEEQNAFSYVMEKHQRKAGANGKIVSYLSQSYLYPHSFDMLIYASQLLQAEAVGYGVEHLRRNRGRCMGAVYWQVNDCWPVASWSSIDYFGRWKALHYFAGRFYAPVLLSVEVHTALTDNKDVNQECLAKEKTARINLSNETFRKQTGTVVWEVCRADGQVVETGRVPAAVEPMSAQWIQTLHCDRYSLREHYLHCRFEDEEGAVLSQTTQLFCPPKYFRFTDPQLTVSLEENAVVVRAARFAKAVWIDDPDNDLLLQDNYFDMQPGERRVPILRGTPKNLRVFSVYDIR